MQNKEEITEEKSSALTVGQLLKEARIGSSLNLSDAAEYLKLPIEKIKALENDDLEHLPGYAFVRGFARSYAHYLQIDETLLLNTLDRQLPNKNLEKEPKPISDRPANISPFPWGIVGALIVILTVALAIGWWLSSGIKRANVLKTPTHISNPVVHKDIIVPERSLSALPQAPSSAPAAAPKEAHDGNLELNASTDVWVSVYDANGARLLNGILAAGSTKLISGKPPLRVRAANRKWISLRYNNQAVNLTSKKKHRTTVDIKLE